MLPASQGIGIRLSHQLLGKPAEGPVPHHHFNKLLIVGGAILKGQHAEN